MLENDKVFIRESCLQETDNIADNIAVEIAKLLENPKGLDNFLMLLFNKKTQDKIENLMKTKGIGKLPDSEEEWFNSKKTIFDSTVSKGQNETKADAMNSNPRYGEKKTLINSGNETYGYRHLDKNEQDFSSEIKKEWQAEFKPDEVNPIVRSYSTYKSGYKRNFDRFNNEGEPSRNTGDYKNSDNLSTEAKKNIGRWGEKRVFLSLVKEYKERYPNSKVQENDSRFAIIEDGKDIVEILWLSKEEEKGKGYDIKVIEEKTEKYVEVKSTETESKEWFDVSAAQWEFAQMKGEQFDIYRVYSAGTQQVEITVIHNPYDLWKKGELDVTPVRIKL